MDKEQIEELNFQNQRVFASLSRNILCILEDIKVSHDINFDKLKENLPEECIPAIQMADYFDNQYFVHYRKRILDSINLSKRDLDFSVNE